MIEGGISYQIKNFQLFHFLTSDKFFRNKEIVDFLFPVQIRDSLCSTMNRHFHSFRCVFFLKSNLNNLPLIILLFKEHGNLLTIYIDHTYLAVRDLLSAPFPYLDNRDKKAGLQRFYAN